MVCGADGGGDAMAGAGDDGAGMKRLGCRYCEYRADRPSHITRHERIHSGEKPFGCRYCEYRAAVASPGWRRASLCTSAANGEKPFGCRYCEYRAARASSITMHERSHSGEKPFGCRYCEYRATGTQASNITVHERHRRLTRRLSSMIIDRTCTMHV